MSTWEDRTEENENEGGGQEDCGRAQGSRAGLKIEEDATDSVPFLGACNALFLLRRSMRKREE